MPVSARARPMAILSSSLRSSAVRSTRVCRSARYKMTQSPRGTYRAQVEMEHRPGQAGYIYGEAYMYDPSTVEWAKCDALVSEYVGTLQQLTPDALNQRQKNALYLYRALQYLQKHGMVEAEYMPATALRIVAIEQEWVQAD